MKTRGSLKREKGNDKNLSLSEEDVSLLQEALNADGDKIRRTEHSPRGTLKETDNQPPSVKPKKKPTTANLRGGNITRWTDIEKREVAWCWMYGSNARYPKRGTGERCRRMLLKRNVMEKEKINETQNRRFQSIYANIKLGKSSITRKQLGEIEKQVEDYIKTEDQPENPGWIWTFNANIFLL